MAIKERTGGAPGGWATPASLKVEHQELRRELARAAKAGGKTGEAARKVIDLLHPHVVKEEFALPPLTLLRALVRGELRPEAARVAEKLEIHAQMEEEILYPAAILAGEYVRANMITVRR